MVLSSICWDQHLSSFSVLLSQFIMVGLDVGHDLAEVLRCEASTSMVTRELAS